MKVASPDAITCWSTAHSHYPSEIAPLLQSLGPTLGQTEIACQFCSAVGVEYFFFFSSKVQMVTDRLRSFLRECLNSIKQAQTHLMLTGKNSHDRLSCKVAKLQENFLKTRGFVSKIQSFVKTTRNKIRLPKTTWFQPAQPIGSSGTTN